ncbi:MucR family transcriptional regulator [Sphingobium sp. EM0848]|uniref:MucR family transcriptional regulator n=1 Tax=Sphingobium sp. EM0848 TaxID=2743473 RepID=UPI00159C786C|nr:MucR family transcriptional regulator [Sphingobium sp. EM0848]
MAEENQSDITALTVQLLSAFVSKNTVSSEDLADLIKTTRAALIANPAAAVEEAVAESFTPAVSVRKSLSSPDHIISLIDGKPYKTLKRHLAANNLTPEQYRDRYNLPKSYPLVAPSYSESRRAVAEKIGLGKKPAAAAAKPAAAATVPAAASKAEAATTQKAAAPAKKPAAKAKGAASDAPAVISNRGIRAKAASASAKSEPRKRLSIAGPKEDKPAPRKASAAPKAKAASKPKSLKAALEAAGSHLGGDAKATGTVESKS